MPLPDIQHIVGLVQHIFSEEPLSLERVPEGISTYVYRVVFQHDTFYLRVLPEEGASFAPEVLVHTQLYHTQVKVPELIYYEHYNEMLQRSVMVTTEIKGIPVSKSHDLDKTTLQTILTEAGADLACINKITVDGFGWIAREQDDIVSLRAEHPTYRAFALEYWDSDIAYLAKNALQTEDIAALEQIRAHYDAWLEDEQGYLAHGDFDVTHIFQQDAHYSGMIDFGEIRGTNRWYDLAHFHMRDGEMLPYSLLAPLIKGYEEVVALPEDYEQQIRFASLFINMRALARSLQKHPPDRYTEHQVAVLKEDIATFPEYIPTLQKTTS